MYFIVIVLRQILRRFWSIDRGETLNKGSLYYSHSVFQAGVVCHGRTKLLCFCSDSTTAPSVLAGALFTCLNVQSQSPVLANL